MTITRRNALLGITSIAAAGTAGAAATAASISSETLEAYRKDYSAHDRLQHHLLMAAMAVEELARPDAYSWSVWITGRYWSRPIIEVRDYVKDGHDEVADIGLVKSKVILRWPA